MPPPNLYACMNLVVRLPFPLLCDYRNSTYPNVRQGLRRQITSAL